MKGVNHLAVVVAVILHQVLGYLWYGVLFLDPWLAGLSKSASGFDQSEPCPYILDIVGWSVASYVMAWLVRKTGADSPAKGAVLGAVLGLGLAVPALVPHYAFAGLKPIVMVIDAANVLVACVVTGTILAAWQKPAPARSE
jgi:hypothetical protein